MRTLVGRPINWLPCFGPNAGPYLIRSINCLPRSGPNNGPYEIRHVKSLPCSGPNYGPDQVRPFKRLWAQLWPISDSTRQLDAMLLGPLAKGPLSAFWERGSPDLPACGLRRGSKGGPSTAHLHQHKPKTLMRGQASRGGRRGASSGTASSAGSRGGREIKAGYLTRCP